MSYKSIIMMLVISVVTLLTAQNKKSFYDQISTTVIRLEHTALIVRDGQEGVESKNKSNGTAFFVARENELYVVTARHVADINYDLQARVLSKNNLTKNNDRLLLKLPKERWVYHNIDGDNNTNGVDVAVQKIRKPAGHHIVCFLFESKDSELFNTNQLPYTDPEPPNPIISFGFPLDIGFKLEEQRPFGRYGIIAMKTGDEFLKLTNGKYANSENIILDIDMFPGNS